MFVVLFDLITTLMHFTLLLQKMAKETRVSNACKRAHTSPEMKSKVMKNSTEISYQKVKIQGAQMFPSLRMEHVR